MKRVGLMMLALAVIGSVSLAASPQKKGEKPVVLPPAAAQTVKALFPGVEIKTVELEKEAGLNLYDIEFATDKGEVEVAEDGTAMEITSIPALKDIPQPVVDSIRKEAPGATLKRVEKAEVRAELKKEGGKGLITKLAVPKCLYEAELQKGDEQGEIQVAPDGRVIEAPKWKAKGGEKEEEEGEEQPKGPDLKILPPTVLAAFKTSYPQAVIKGTSKETEQGVTYYEVESVDGKLNRDVLYTADGKTAEIEEALPSEALPAVVQLAVAKAYPGSKIIKAEAMTKGVEKLFELRVQGKTKKFSVTVDPQGRIIAPAQPAQKSEK